MAKDLVALKSSNDQLAITINIAGDRVATLRRAFSDLGDIQNVAQQVGELATNEFIDLLAGRKRYISLSHQYIEWLQQLYEVILPNEEYTYRRLLDKFNFPPGTAAYVARVLRQRQTTKLHEKAKEGLRVKLDREIKAFAKLDPRDPSIVSQKQRSLRLTAREHDLLHTLVDYLMGQEEDITYPAVTTRGREFVVVTLHISHIQLAFSNLEKL
jgi:hypothetical protein